MRDACRFCRGFSLIEGLVAVSLVACLLLIPIPPMIALLSASRLESTIQNLTSVLSFARSEALRSGRGVWICALFMRKNEHHNGCRTSPGQLAEGWTDGVLLFADHEGARPGIYDAGEDLRDVGFSPTVSVVSGAGHYYVTGRGVYATAGLPAFVLREKYSGRCATVQIHADSVLPVSCRGGECEGCSRHAPE